MAQTFFRRLTAALLFTGLGLSMLLYTNCETDNPGISEAPDVPKPDKNNFHIYLCFGQSNMEGYNGAYVKDEDGNPIQAEDLGFVDSRFRVLTAVDMPAIGRVKERWYRANPPLCRGDSGICPVDYFGRTMTANLPPEIKVGVINVSIAGCKIEAFDRDNCEAYLAATADWLQTIAGLYGRNPYNRLVELAKIAQKDGVIKGILLHQGESNSGDTAWPQKVKGIYDNLVSDLGLDENVPLLAGQLVNGGTTGMNGIILGLPGAIPGAHVIRTDDLGKQPDNQHFSPEGYRELGRRYAVEMLSILGYPRSEQAGKFDRPHKAMRPLKSRYF
jgi:alpha-L-fucosidase 2